MCDMMGEGGMCDMMRAVVGTFCFSSVHCTTLEQVKPMAMPEAA